MANKFQKNQVYFIKNEVNFIKREMNLRETDRISKLYIVQVIIFRKDKMNFRKFIYLKKYELISST